MASEQLFKIFQDAVPNFAKLGPEDLIRVLNEKKTAEKLKKKKVPEAQVMQVVNYLQVHKPNSQQLAAYLRKLAQEH